MKSLNDTPTQERTRLQQTELHLMKMLRYARGYEAAVRGRGNVPIQMQVDINEAEDFLNHGPRER
jgi:hypothetical protein